MARTAQIHRRSSLIAPRQAVTRLARPGRLWRRLCRGLTRGIGHAGAAGLRLALMFPRLERRPRGTEPTPSAAGIPAGEDAEDFLAAMAEIRLLRFLSSRLPRARLLVDPYFAAVLLGGDNSEVPWRLRRRICRLSDFPRFVRIHPHVKEYFVLARGREKALVARLARRYPRKTFFSVKNDVVPYLVSSRRHSFRRAVSDAPRLPGCLYAVLCTPRSGSSHLCDQLQHAGMGRPKEHLRAPLVTALRMSTLGDVDPSHLIGRIHAADGRPAMFGTKIISHFLFQLLRLHGNSLLDRSLFSEFKIVYLYRQDKVLQAISAVVAAELKRWHAFSPDRVTDIQENFIEYDFDKILNRYDFYLEQEKKIHALLSHTEYVLPICYEEEVDGNVEHAVEKVARFLGHPHEPRAAMGPATRYKLRNEKSHAYAERFAAEYEARFGSSPERRFRPRLADRPVSDRTLHPPGT